MADSSEEEDGGPSLNLTGFLFGNINEKGELEDSDILDEVSHRRSLVKFTKMLKYQIGQL